jgi:hypothetical protein
VINAIPVLRRSFLLFALLVAQAHDEMLFTSDAPPVKTLSFDTFIESLMYAFTGADVNAVGQSLGLPSIVMVCASESMLKPVTMSIINISSLKLVARPLLPRYHPPRLPMVAVPCRLLTFFVFRIGFM